MEQEIIKKEIQKGTISEYCRFVDHIYCVVNKRHKNRIINSLNNFDNKFIKFTTEAMVNNSLTYLDTEIYLDPQTLPQIKKISKENNFRCDYKLQ